MAVCDIDCSRAPKQLSDCHCVDCRRASGAPFVTWGSFPRDKIELLSGAVRKVKHADRFRSFAACCGTPLFFEVRDCLDRYLLYVCIGMRRPIRPGRRELKAFS